MQEYFLEQNRAQATKAFEAPRELQATIDRAEDKRRELLDRNRLVLAA